MVKLNISAISKYSSSPSFPPLGHAKPASYDDDMQADDGTDYNYEDESSSQDRISSESNSVTDDLIPTTLGKAKTEYHAKPGESVTMQCPIMNKGKSVVIWYKGKTAVSTDSATFSPDKKYEVDFEWSLKIKNVDLKDEDSYQCKIVPGNLSLFAKLLIVKTPVIRIIEGDRDVTNQQLSFHEGEKIRLDCQTTDNPQPKYIWSLNGTRLDKQHGVVVDKGVLIIENAQSHHSDIFQCLAENNQGLLTHKIVSIHVDCKWRRFLIFPVSL